MFEHEFRPTISSLCGFQLYFTHSILATLTCLNGWPVFRFHSRIKLLEQVNVSWTSLFWGSTLLNLVWALMNPCSASYGKWKCQSLSCVWLFVTAWTVANWAPLFMEFFRQEYWSGCHFLLQGTRLTQGSSTHLLHFLHWRQILYHWATRED